MFVYSVKASSIRFFGIITVSVLALISIAALIPTYEPVTAVSSVNGETVKYDKIKTNEDRIAFLAQFGWEVKSEPEEETTVTIPAEFDKVFLGYNELQKRQGLNLSKYRRKEVTRCTYAVTNYPGYDGTVYANLLIYRNKIIGGDICSADSSGFIHGFSPDVKY